MIESKADALLAELANRAKAFLRAYDDYSTVVEAGIPPKALEFVLPSATMPNGVSRVHLRMDLFATESQETLVEALKAGLEQTVQQNSSNLLKYCADRALAPAAESSAMYTRAEVTGELIKEMGD